ncbi:unnamed protein product [Gadus morhua 'NCC']
MKAGLAGRSARQDAPGGLRGEACRPGLPSGLGSVDNPPASERLEIFIKMHHRAGGDSSFQTHACDRSESLGLPPRPPSH